MSDTQIFENAFVSSTKVVEHPVFIPTSQGVFGATITTPHGDSRAAMVIMAGLSEERSGANSIWRTMAQSIASSGVTVLRYDSAGVCDSHLTTEGDEGDDGTLEVIRWFVQATDGLPLVTLGYCKGVKFALTLAMEDPAPIAVGLMCPPKRYLPKIAPTGARRFRSSLSSMFKKPIVTDSKEEDDPEVEFFVRAPTRAPTWILLGSEDKGSDEARGFATENRHGERLRVDVVEGVEVHWFTAPIIQREVITRVISWAQSVLETLPKGT